MKRKNTHNVDLGKLAQKVAIPLNITKKAISSKKKLGKMGPKALEQPSDDKVLSMNKEQKPAVDKSRNINLRESLSKGKKDSKKEIKVEETNESKFRPQKEKQSIKSNSKFVEQVKAMKKASEEDSPRRNIIEVKMDFEFLKQRSKRTIFTK